MALLSPACLNTFSHLMLMEYYGVCTIYLSATSHLYSKLYLHTTLKDVHVHLFSQKIMHIYFCGAPGVIRHYWHPNVSL